MYAYAKWWENTSKNYKHCSDRVVMALVPNVEGRATLAMRYICKQNPPQELESVGQVVRFVSLIPFVVDATVFEGRTKVWSDSQEFLDVPAGDVEEHAILLCNYFLYLGKVCAQGVLRRGSARLFFFSLPLPSPSNTLRKRSSFWGRASRKD